MHRLLCFAEEDGLQERIEVAEQLPSTETLTVHDAKLL